MYHNMQEFQEDLAKLLNREYCRLEDAVMENDMDKTSFRRLENVLEDVAHAAMLERRVYPFKPREI